MLQRNTSNFVSITPRISGVAEFAEFFLHFHASFARSGLTQIILSWPQLSMDIPLARREGRRR
jgi:hypothetical protein